MDPGAFVCVNNDDSDGDGVVDLDDNDVGDADPDLEEVTLKIEPTDLDVGTIVLTPTSDDGAVIKVFLSSDKSDGEKYSWDLSDEDEPLPASVWVEGVAVGDVNLKMTLKYDNNGDDIPEDICDDTVKVTVVEVDIDLTGVADADEESVGGFVGLNNDDDNTNGTPDKDESGTVTGEDDLETITLNKVLPVDLTGSVTLSAGSGLKIWESPTRGTTPLSLPKTYSTPSELPKNLYVEGTTASSAIRDSHVKLEYTIDGKTFEDEIKVTVVEVDIDMTGVTDEGEEKVGGFVGLNDDDNNFNGTIDKDDTSFVTDEDDLVPITLSKVQPVALTGSVTLSAGSGLTIWESPTRGTTPLSLPATYSTPSALPKILYVEGTTTSSAIRDSHVKLEYTISGKTFKDEIKVTVVDVDITEPDGSLDWGTVSGGLNPNISWQGTAITTKRFDFQGLISGQPGPYDLTITGAITSLTGITYHWTLDSACGTLSDTTTATPYHTSPAAEGQGTLKLQAYYDSDSIGVYEERVVKIYKDHLARDEDTFPIATYTNGPWTFSAFNVASPISMEHYNCHRSTLHQYNGSTGDDESAINTIIGSTTPKAVVTVTHDPSGNGSHPSLGTLNRGDIILYYMVINSTNALMHSQTCTETGTNTFGANNEPMSFPGLPANQSWKIANSTAGDWANALWLPNPPYDVQMPVTIKVYDKP